MIYNSTSDAELNQLIDEIEDTDTSYTVEELDGYFLCSQHYWDELSPSEQAELLSQHPHLQDHFL